jgi:molybdopterin converting factor small subunit
MAVLLLFAAAREAAGTGREEVDGTTVGEVLASVLDASRVWRNGEPTSDDEPVGASDEVAVLPPVSGG